MERKLLDRLSVIVTVLILCLLHIAISKTVINPQIIDSGNFESKIIIEDPGADTAVQRDTGSVETPDIGENDTDAISKVQPSNTPETADVPYCNFKIIKQSVKYWQERIRTEEPDFVQFTLQLNHSYTVASRVLKPMEWVWTYDTPSGSPSFLHWPLDYGTLSFGLLNAKALSIKYIKVYATNDKQCKVHIGRNETTYHLAKAFIDLVNYSSNPHPYYNNKFCFYEYTVADPKSFSYLAALYLRYPFSNAQKMYSCCSIRLMYGQERYRKQCFKIARNWGALVAVPYVLGIMFFMFSPILMFSIASSFTRECNSETEHYVMISRHDFTGEPNHDSVINDWVYLDGEPPLTFFDMFSVIPVWFKRRHPMFMSRMVRLIILVALPLSMLPQLYMYKKGVDKHGQTTIEDLLRIGIPSTFNALLSKDLSLMVRQFVPIFGGPIGLLVIYVLLGIVLIVAPRDFQQTVENGMPNTRQCSILFLGFQDICNLSNVHSEKHISGYRKVSTILKASVYMLFGRKFWSLVLCSTGQRFARVSRLSLLIKLFIYPLLIVLCLIETIVALLFYALPICGCLSITMKGVALTMYRTSFRNQTLNRLFHSKCCKIVIAALVLFLWVIFVFAGAHVLMQNFMFAAQLFLYCFIAIFTYPSVAFGYMFFFVAFLFYLIKLVREVGDDYLELLNMAVDISRDMDNEINSVTIRDHCLHVKDLRCVDVDDIFINDVKLNVSANILRLVGKYEALRKSVRRDHTFGIPQELFTTIVNSHLPTQIRRFKVLMNIMLVVVFVVFAIRITSVSATRPTTEMSDVMHVIFVVVLGAVPRIIEVALVGETKSVKQEIRIRSIEKTIRDYWHDKEHELFIR